MSWRRPSQRFWSVSGKLRLGSDGNRNRLEGAGRSIVGRNLIAAGRATATIMSVGELRMIIEGITLGDGAVHRCVDAISNCVAIHVGSQVQKRNGTASRTDGSGVLNNKSSIAQ